MPIELVPYDPEWVRRFAVERDRIGGALGAEAVRVEHVGSTAVPGLAAKDVVDVQLSVADLEDEDSFRPALEGLGYVHLPDDEPQHRFFKLDDDAGRRRVNVHVCGSGSDWERRHLAFRDHLRTDPRAAREYLRLKRRLAAVHDDVNDYAGAKTEWIRKVEASLASSPPLAH